MSTGSEQPSSRQQRLEEILAEYLRSVDAGNPADSRQLISQHPDLADDLAEFFGNRAAIARWGNDFRNAADVPTRHPDSMPSADAIDRIRYFGDYVLESEIARGGMGVVYRARQVSLNRVVAVKMILAGNLASRAEVQRFRAEAETAANLDHPNIVPIYEVGEHEGQHYFSMKLIEGPSLAQAIRSQAHPFTCRAAAELIIQCARAIHHAHQRGMLHRDLKPGNILLDADGQPHITDFGLAKRVDGESDLTHTGTVVGTLDYMAPEQAKGERQLTTAVDVFSLGAVLYELLAGRPPFSAATPTETLLRLQSSDPAPLLNYPRQVDRDLNTLCLKCLEKDPQRRYDSASALADDLQRWWRGEPIVARPASSWERLFKWVRRRPAWAASLLVSLAALVTLLVGLGLSLHAISREQRRTLLAHSALTIQQAETAHALERLKRRSYTQTLALARSEWEADNAPQAVSLLEDCPQELRHWEWDYLRRLFHSAQQEWTHRLEDPQAMAFHPTRELLAIGGGATGFGPYVGSQELLLWDAAANKLAEPFRTGTFTGAVTGLAWSPEGTRLALSLWCMDDARDVVVTAEKTDVNMSGRIEIWDVARHTLAHSLLDHHSFVNDVAISPHGRLVASASSDRTANVWDLDSGQLLQRLQGHTGQVMCVAFSPDSQLIATGGQGPLSNHSSVTPHDMGEVKIWSTVDGSEQQSLAGHEVGVLSVAFSPDSRILATASRDQTVRLWDTSTGALLRTLFGHHGPVMDIAWSSDGQHIASASGDSTARIWDAANGRLLKTFRGHSGIVNNVSYQPGRDIVISMGPGPRGEVEVKTWDTRLPQEYLICQGTVEDVEATCFSPDETLLAALSTSVSSDRQELRIWDTGSGQLVARIEADQDAIEDFCFSADSKQLTTLGGSDAVTVARYDARSGRCESTFSAFQREEGSGFYPTVQAALGRHGQFAATGDLNAQEIVLWDSITQQPLWKVPFQAAHITELAFSPDNLRLAAITQRQDRGGGRIDWKTVSVRILDTRDGAEIVHDKPNDFYGWREMWSPDAATLAIAGDDQGVRLWHVVARESSPRELECEKCLQLRFSHNGKSLVTVHKQRDSNTMCMKVWDVASARLLFTLSDFVSAVRSYDGGEVQFSPDDARLFTCGDGTLKVWDATDGQLLFTLRPAGRRLAVSNTGQRLATTSPDKGIHIWSTDRP